MSANEIWGISLVAAAIILSLVLGYFIGYRHGAGHWR